MKKERLIHFNHNSSRLFNIVVIMDVYKNLFGCSCGQVVELTGYDCRVFEHGIGPLTAPRARCLGLNSVLSAAPKCVFHCMDCVKRGPED